MPANKTYRIGKRNGQNRWQVKESPGWRVARQCDTLAEAAEWLRAEGVDLSTVVVLSKWPWPTLPEALANPS